jgi:hypothetical protein
MPSEIFCSSLLTPSTTASTSSPTLSTSEALGDALGPGHLGDVHQALDARLELDERAVGHEVDDLAADAVPTGYLALDVVPRIRPCFCLRPSETRSFSRLTSRITTSSSWPDLDHLARVVDAAPAHVGDVQQAVHAVEVDERAEVGDVLDRALADLAGWISQQRFFCSRRLLFDQLAARQDDVAALLLILMILNSSVLPMSGRRVAHGHTSTCEPGRKASTPTSTIRPPLTRWCRP